MTRRTFIDWVKIAENAMAGAVSASAMPAVPGVSVPSRGQRPKEARKRKLRKPKRNA